MPRTNSDESGARRAVRGNRPKYESYHAAFGGIKKALENCYHLEAITVEESIIADRVASFLWSIKVLKKEPTLKGPTLGSLVKEWNGCSAMARALLERAHPGASELLSEVDKWCKNRNICIHRIVRSSPGCPPMPILSFKKLAARTAEDGNLLARRVDAFVKRNRSAEAKKA